MLLMFCSVHRAQVKWGGNVQITFVLDSVQGTTMVFARRFNSMFTAKCTKGTKVSDTPFCMCYLGIYRPPAALASQFVGNPYKADLTLTERHHVHGL